MMDGELCEEWNLAKLLAPVRFSDSFGRALREQRPEVFKRWKAKAHKTRIQLGLHVVPLEEDTN